MENLKIIKKYMFLLMILFAVDASAQVVIGGTTIDDGAIFQMKSSNKGLMIPKVSLTARTDVTTIDPGNVEGLWVYNVANSGSGLDRVAPGFYFWDASKWVRIYNEGFTVQFEQTETQRSADNTTIYTLPGLDQDVVAPYTGTYEIHVTGYIACPSADDTSRDGTVVGAYMLEIDNVKVAESMVSSNTKIVTSHFQALGRQTTFVYHVDLSAGQSYNFKVRTRQWMHENAKLGSLSGIYPGNYAFWGISSTPYNGNNIPAIDNAQDAYLTITLLRQF